MSGYTSPKPPNTSGKRFVGGAPMTYGDRVGESVVDGEYSSRRARTPQEAQKGMAKVDADDERALADKVQAGYAKSDAERKNVPSYKKGGMVKKTGLAKLHRGEKVIRKQDVKKTNKAVRKYAGKKS